MNDRHKVGIVLEGGGMRGMYSCGILDVLMGQHIYLDGMVGVSAGIAFGCNYKSHQAGRALRYNMRFSNDKRYAGMRSLLTTGDYYNAHFAFHSVPNHYDIFDRDTFEVEPMQCWAVCTDVDTGLPVYHQLTQAGDEAFEWIRASASMPVVARPVTIDGQRLLDGGLTDSIPVQFMQQQGFDKLVVVLTREQGYVKRPERMMWLMRLLLHRYPRVIEALKQRPDMYNQQVQLVSELERQGTAMVFRPVTPLNISRTSHDPAQMKRVYEQGHNEAVERLAELKKFINNTQDDA